MSHADTIRREMPEREYQWLRPTPIGQNIIDLYATVAAERDALLAENQRRGQILARLVAWSKSVPRDKTEMLHVIVADAREAAAGDAE